MKSGVAQSAIQAGRMISVEGRPWENSQPLAMRETWVDMRLVVMEIRAHRCNWLGHTLSRLATTFIHLKGSRQPFSNSIELDHWTTKWIGVTYSCRVSLIWRFFCFKAVYFFCSGECLLSLYPWRFGAVMSERWAARLLSSMFAPWRRRKLVRKKPSYHAITRKKVEQFFVYISIPLLTPHRNTLADLLVKDGIDCCCHLPASTSVRSFVFSPRQSRTESSNLCAISTFLQAETIEKCANTRLSSLTSGPPRGSSSSPSTPGWRFA